MEDEKKASTANRWLVVGINAVVLFVLGWILVDGFDGFAHGGLEISTRVFLGILVFSLISL